MKKLLFLIFVALMMTGCVVHPGYYGSYDSGYYGYPYGYVNPQVNLNFSSGHRHHGYHGGYGYNHGRYGGGWRR